jgi:hypothetical protein
MFNHARTRIQARAELAAAALITTLSVCGQAHAQTGPALLVEPFPKEQFIDTRGGYLLPDAGHVKGSDEGIRLSFYEATGRVRVIPGNLISPRIGWDLEYIDVDTRSDLLPGQLTDQSVGIAFPVAKVSEWIFGVSLGVGYAGAAPYGEGDAWYGKATAVAFRQLGEKDALVFIVDYDGNRTFLPDVPLPGFAYLKHMDPTLTLLVGLPLTSVTWTPVPKFSAELGWLPTESFHAAVGYEFAPHWTVFGNLEHHTSAFHLPDLADNDRLLFQQRRAEIGLRWAPREARESLAFTAAAGYAWHQEFSVGFDARKTDRVLDASDEPYVRFGFEMKF